MIISRTVRITWNLSVRHNKSIVSYFAHANYSDMYSLLTTGMGCNHFNTGCFLGLKEMWVENLNFTCSCCFFACCSWKRYPYTLLYPLTYFCNWRWHLQLTDLYKENMYQIQKPDTIHLNPTLWSVVCPSLHQRRVK